MKNKTNSLIPQEKVTIHEIDIADVDEVSEPIEVMDEPVVLKQGPTNPQLIADLNEEAAIYLMNHKDTPLWQNMRKFAGAKFLLFARDIDIKNEEAYVGIRDTFFVKGKLY